MSKTSAATLSDVASHAGVSKDTASVVLNGSRSNTRVSEDTRRRVLEAAKQLRYRPNVMARSLARRRMDTLGVLFGLVRFPVIANDFVAPILQGIMSAAGERNFNVTLFTSRWQDAEHSASSYGDRRTDGIILISPPTDSDMVPGLAALGIPLVVVNWPCADHDLPYVYSDDQAGTRLATEYLLALGHRRVAHLIGTPNKASASVRRDTFITTMAQAGVSTPPAYLVPGSYRAETTYQDVQHLLSLPEPPTAIFCGNDVIAAEALRAARERGVSVPEQLSLVCYDDAPLASHTAPPLTTVRMPLIQIGETAARLLIASVEGEPIRHKKPLIKPELVVRGSAAQPGFSER